MKMREQKSEKCFQRIFLMIKIIIIILSEKNLPTFDWRVFERTATF